MDGYYSDASSFRPQNNQMAVISIVAGLGGWLVFILFMCLSLAFGALGALTFGVGSILSVCLIPVQCLIPIAWIVGVVTGHMALGQIRDSGGVEGGRGMAIAGLISGYLGLGIICLLLVLLIILVVTGASLPFLEEILEEFGQLLSIRYG